MSPRWPHCWKSFADRWAWAALCLLTCLGVQATALDAQSSVVVHLPSTPVENASRRAAAITEWTALLSQQIPGLDLQAKIFRRLNDAEQALADGSTQTVMVLSDASLLLTIPANIDWIPSYRFVRNGQTTYRRLVVVRSDREQTNKLIDLRGKRLAWVETTGAQRAAEFLDRRVFADELIAEDWFARLEVAADDFEATARVIYEQIDAALVAEFNPLVERNLGSELKTVYTSPALSLPILTLRSDLLDREQRAALMEALERLPQMPAGKRLLAELGIDGFRAISATQATALRGLTSAAAKEFSIAVTSPPRLEPASPPRPQWLDYLVTVELPETGRAISSTLEPERQP